MRSRHDKRQRSRISPVDRLLQSSKGRTILAAVRPTTQTSVQPSSELKRANMVERTVYRLQHPVGWWPLIVLGIIWIFMLGIIWGAFQEIMSLGASPVKQTVMQLERKSLIELFAALCLGGIGLSLALTPALKRPRRDNPELRPANTDRTTNK